MTPNTDDIERFRDRWNSHIDDYARLKFSVPNEMEREEREALFAQIDEARDQLREAVEQVADAREEDRA